MTKSASVALALEFMTGPSRGARAWLTASALDVTLDEGCFIKVAETQADGAQPGTVARLHRIDDTYEIESLTPGVPVWLNGTRMPSGRLKHGDTVEFGETGPLCRVRFFSSHMPGRNSVENILSDIGAYIRVSRQPLPTRLWRAARALVGRLSHETGVLFRITLVAAVIGIVWLGYQQSQLDARLESGIRATEARFDQVAGAIVNAQRDALRPSDLSALNESLDRRLESNVSRLEALETRSGFGSRVVADTSARVAFLQGGYGYRDRNDGRMLRHVVGDDGVPGISSRGQPLLSVGGAGPVVELQFTGTGFLVGTEGTLVTNRHVALPWEQGAAEVVAGHDGLEPVMLRFVSYLPGETAAVPVTLVRASETADIALLRRDGTGDEPPGLELAGTPPLPGEEVIVMGFPTGLRSMIAQSGKEFVEALRRTRDTDFWKVAERLAAGGHVAPLASRGIVARQTASVVVYDAETASGGSGGPVLNRQGHVIAVNAAVLPEYGGSNLGVPVAELKALLEANVAN